VTLKFEKMPEDGGEGTFSEKARRILAAHLKSCGGIELIETEVGDATDVDYGDNPKTEVEDLAQQFLDSSPPTAEAVRVVEAELVSKADLDAAPNPIETPINGVKVSEEEMANMPGAVKLGRKHET